MHTLTEPSTTTQPSRLRDLLALRWRNQVDLVTDLAIRRHSIDETDVGQDALVDALDAQLSDARRQLADIEAALHQLDPRHRLAMAGGAG